jgi:hypothetical protein
MVDGLLTREPVAGYGELRAYRHLDRGELVFEAFREEDGRAWLLRLPLRERSAAAFLARHVAPMLTNPAAFAIDDGGAAVIHQVALGPDAQLAAVMLEGGEERAFTLWRQERLRAGWSWTIDVVLVPWPLAGRLCALVLETIGRLDAAGRERNPGLA